MIIKVNNLQTESAVKTFLATSPSASGTALTIKNSNGFAVNWYAQIGETGEEKTEIKSVGSVASSTSIYTTAISFTHPVDTPVYCVKYDQVVFKCSTAGTSGTATALTDGTISITPDWEYTQFDHTTGSASYAYKTCYRSSVSGAVSPDSGWLTSGGYSAYSLAHMRNRIKGKLDNNTEVKDSDVDDWVNEWLEAMNNAVVAVNEDYALGTATVTWSGTAQEGTISNADFKYVRKVEYTESGDYYIATKTEFANVHPTDSYNYTRPFYYMKDERTICRLPYDNNGTATVTYYKLQDKLQDDTDELPTPFRGYTNSFVKWGLAQAKRRDRDFQVASELENQAMVDLEKFKMEIAPRNKSGETYIDLVEETGEDIDSYL